MNENKHYVAYYRVSTEKQGKSRLGLEAQQEIVHRHVHSNKLLAEFVEVESGKKDARIELEKALAFTKEHNAILVIAKLDRLSRNVAFIFKLRDAGVQFECCDVPQLNTLTLGVFATMAQYERELISKRTTEALQAKKRQGAKLGSPQGFKKGVREQGPRTLHKDFLTRNNTLYEIIKTMYEYEKLNFRQIASKLASMGFRSKLGKIMPFSYIAKVYKAFSNS